MNREQRTAKMNSKRGRQRYGNRKPEQDREQRKHKREWKRLKLERMETDAG